MKESKGVYVTKHSIREDLLNRNYHLYTSNVTRDYKYGNSTRDVGVQYNYRRDNVICTCRNISGLRTRRQQEVRYFSGLPKQIYTYHGSRSYTDIGVGSVKAYQRRRVKRIYLPQTDDRGVGSSDLSSFICRKTTYYRGSYYGHKKTSSKCVGGVIEENVDILNERLSPIVRTRAGTTSPSIPLEEEKKNVEIGSNTHEKSFVTASTQIQDGDLKAGDIKEVKVVAMTLDQSQPRDITQQSTTEPKTKPVIATSTDEPHAKRISKRAQEAERVFSSDSLVQHVHNLEHPSEDNPASRAVIDPMENKLEREYRKMFSTKSKDSKEPKSSHEEKPAPDIKSTSVLRRRFEALRRGLAKKDDAKKNAAMAAQESSNVSALNQRDVSIASDPPSLEARSFSNPKIFNASPSTDQDRDASTSKAVYKKSFIGRRDWSRTDEDDSEFQNVKGMFKLWGKKFDLDDDEASPGPSVDISKKPKDKIPATESESKKDGKKFFFFKKKSKDKTKQPYKQKKGVTAGRCEVGDGLMIKIGAANSPPPEKERKEINQIPEEYEDMLRKAWLQQFLAQTIESRPSVKVRWNNNAYATSSSTIFEIMENVYKDTGVVFRSKSEVTTGDSSYYTYKTVNKQQVNFVQDIEAWMVPKCIPDKAIPITLKKDEKGDKKDNIEVRISDQKWFIDKSNAFAQKINVVLHSTNLEHRRKDSSSEYLRIDIPKGFFSDSGSDANQIQTSNEEVYKIVEYESPEYNNYLKTNKNIGVGDHLMKDIKVTVSVKSRELESKILETVIKRPPIHRDVVIQGSNVHIPKKYNVIGVGIIKQKDITKIRKPILKMREEYTDDESDHNMNYCPQNSSKFAESYLQDYYRHWSPLDIDYDYCVSDSLLRCGSEISHTTVNQQGDGSRSCPNISDDYQASAISSCDTSCCSHGGPWEKGPSIKNRILVSKIKQVFRSKNKEKDKEELEILENEMKRVLPKDSLEVFKKRQLYAASNKSNWSSFADDRPYSVPSNASRSAQGCLPECPKPKKISYDPCPKEVNTNNCKKRVRLPNTEQVKETSPLPPGILQFKGSSKCELCKKEGESCPKHLKILPSPTCVIPDLQCFKPSPKPSCPSPPKSPPCYLPKLECPPKPDLTRPESLCPPMSPCFTPPHTSPPKSSTQSPTGSQGQCPSAPKLPQCDPSHKYHSPSKKPPCLSPSRSPLESPCPSPPPRPREQTMRVPSHCGPPCGQKCPPSPPRIREPPPTPPPSKRASSKRSSPRPCPPPCSPPRMRHPSPRTPSLPKLTSNKLCSQCSQKNSQPISQKSFCQTTPLPCPSPPRTKPSPPSQTSTCKGKPVPCSNTRSNKTSPSASCKNASLKNRNQNSRSPSPCSPPQTPKPPCKSPPPCPSPPARKQSPASQTSTCKGKPVPCSNMRCTKTSPSASCKNASLKNRNQNSHSPPPCSPPQTPKPPCKSPPPCPSSPSKPSPPSHTSICKGKPVPCSNIRCNKTSRNQISNSPPPCSPPQTPKPPNKCTRPVTPPRPKCESCTKHPCPMNNQESAQSLRSAAACPQSATPISSEPHSPAPCSPPQSPKPPYKYARPVTPPSPKSESCPEYPWPTKNQESDQSLRSAAACPRSAAPIPPEPCPGPPKKLYGCVCPAHPPRPPTPPESCQEPPQITGIYLKMKPRSQCCTASDNSSQCPQKCSERESSAENITIKIKQETASTEEIRGGPYSLKVKDEDGRTLYERCDYKKHRPSVLDDVYRSSLHHHTVSTSIIQNMAMGEESDVEIQEAKSNASIANLIEINFKLKVIQGDKTTEINIGNDDVRDEKPKNTRSEFGQTSQEVFMLKDEAEQCSEEKLDKNDINIKIVIKNYKPKKNIFNKKCCTDAENFNTNISDKFLTISNDNGYKDVVSEQPVQVEQVNNDDQNAENVFSVHRTTIDLTTSNEVSRTQLATNENYSDVYIAKEPIDVMISSRIATGKSGAELSEDKLEYISSNKVSEDENEQEHYKEKHGTYYSMTDTDDPEVAGDFSNENDDLKSMHSAEILADSLTKEEKKRLLRTVFEKASNPKKMKNQQKLKQLREILKNVLTSDSSGHDEIAVTSNELAKEMTYASLKPNYFRDTDSMNNYYKIDSSAISSTKGSIVKPNTIYPTENVSQCSVRDIDGVSSDDDDEDKPNQGCLCSTLAARLNMCSGVGGVCCCRKPLKTDEETCCDLRTEEDLFLLNYKTIEYIDVDTQNSKYVCNSKNISVHSRGLSGSIRNCVDVRTIKDTGLCDTDEKLSKTLSPGVTHAGPCCEIKKISRKTLSILQNISKSREKGQRKHREKVNSSFDRPADILQCYETKKAVLEIYAEKALSDDERLVAKLPKFVINEENELERKYSEYAESYKNMKRNFVMSVNR